MKSDINTGDRVDVYRDGKMWCPNALVTDVSATHLSFYNQGQDDTISVPLTQCIKK